LTDRSRLCGSRTALVLLFAASFTMLSATPAARAAFPGANGRIAFGGQALGAGIRTVNPDGSGDTQVTTFGSSPRWSPDGRRIVFEKYTPASPVGTTDIYVVNADGTGVMQMTSDGKSTRPSWTPDGRIGFTSQRDGAQDIYIMDADGGNEQRITQGGYFWSPVWSPDGQRIATFGLVQPFNGHGLFVMNADGNGISQPLAQTGGSPYAGFQHLDWSPNSQQLVYDEQPSANNKIVWKINRDGGGQTQLAAFRDQSPSWSPDGTKIAFTHETFSTVCNPNCETVSTYDVWAMNPDGSSPAQVTAGNHGWYEGTSWQPLSKAPHPRPGGATPVRISLVPAFANCTVPNSTHVAPLAQPSCAPPVQESSQLTTSSNGGQSAVARLDVQVGNPATPANEADVRISANVTDVRCASASVPGCTTAGGDYGGKTLFSSVLRITDRRTGPGGVSGTIGDFRFDVPVDCVPTPADPLSGSACNVDTTANSLLPGFALEGQRAVISTYTFRLLDQGPDGTITPPSGSCPPSCRSGDESSYLTQGVFAP
jgi:hypothetical protein